MHKYKYLIYQFLDWNVEILYKLGKVERATNGRYGNVNETRLEFAKFNTSTRIILWYLFVVMFAYEQCLLVFPYHTHIWYEAAQYLEFRSKFMAERGVLIHFNW